MNPLVSIIVPIYNVEKHLRNCLSSVEEQTYQNYEVLLINDGSTDSSGHIIEEYTKKDNRFTAINQINGGLSAARNTGIYHARGEYMFFLDSDDYIEKDAINNLVTALGSEKFDIILANAYRVQGNSKSLIKNIKSDTVYESGEAYMIEKMQARSYHPAVWMNLYSSKLILANGLYFAPRKLHEDVEWLPRVLIKAHKIKEIDDIVYNYIIRPNSITTRSNQQENGEHLMFTAKKLEKLNFSSKCNRRIFLDYLANIYMNGAYIGKFRAKEVERYFPIYRASSISCVAKSILFLLNPNLYYFFRNKAERRNT